MMVVDQGRSIPRPEELARAALGGEPPRHNLAILKQIHGGTELILAEPVEFDPRPDYWWRPERRFLVAYFHTRFKEWPPGAAEAAMAELVVELSTGVDALHEQKLIKFEEPLTYTDSKRRHRALQPILTWAQGLRPFPYWSELKSGKQPAPTASQSLSLFCEAVQRDGYEKHERGIGRRMPWFAALGVRSVEALESRQRFFAGYSNALMSHNSYRKAGSQNFGPILGNTSCQALLQVLRQWRDGATRKKAPLKGYDRSSESMVDVSDGSVARELWGFFNLQRQPFYNKMAVAYTEINADPELAVQEIGNQTRSWLEANGDRTAELAKRFDAVLREPATRSEWAQTPLRHWDGNEGSGLDRQFYADLGTAALRRLSDLSPVDKAATLLHLTLDQLVYQKASHKSEPDLVSEPTEEETHVALTRSPSSLLSGTRVWLYAPGAKATHWEVDEKLGHASIGYWELGDLKGYPTEASLFEALQDQTEGDAEPVVASRACWRFARELEKGDWIIARNGRSRIVGIGRVRGDYQYDPSDSSYPHQRPVQWLWRGDYSIQDKRSLPVATLTDCTKRINLLRELEALLPGIDPKPDTEIDEFVPYQLEDALADLFIADSEVEAMLGLLRRKLNIVLQGPPGVGKTFVAKRLAYLLLGSRDDERVRIVQFHQAYTYEQFVRGYRPDGEGGFELASGPFFKLAETAKSDPDQSYVLIIDEINRGNLSKILGEGMMLLEADKRSEDWGLELAYTRTKGEKEEVPFYLPPNLYVIGTMNTADRSLALVDYALRRRFSFVTLRPGFEQPRFAEHLGELPEDILQALQSRVRKINELIEADLNLGSGFLIGHSYFCRGDKVRPWEENANAWLDSICRYEILPLLEEYWYDDRVQLERAKQELGLRLP